MSDRNRNARKKWSQTISRLLPGDHIHSVAPSNRAIQTSGQRIDAIDAARLKRMRKQQQRAAQGHAQRKAKGGE